MRPLRPAKTPVTFLGAASILTAPFNQNTLPLIVPGPQTTVSAPNSSGTDNLIVDGTNSSFKVTFDRPMQVSTFTPGQVLQIMGPTGSVSGPQYFASDSLGQTIPSATSATVPGTLNSTLTVPSFGGTFKVAKLTVQLNAAFPTDSALTATLIAPDGTKIPLFSDVGGTGSNFVNTIFDDSALTPIASGTAPFTGTFKPTGSLSTGASSLLGHTVDFKNTAGQWVPGVWTLQLTNSKTGVTGTLGSWSLNITPVITVDAGWCRGWKRDTVHSRLPPAAAQRHLHSPARHRHSRRSSTRAPDVNKNAGLDVLRDQGQNDPTTPVLYTAADLPKPIPVPTSSTQPGQVSSTIVVPDDFLVQGDKTTSGVSGLRVQINLSYPNDPDLTATLYYDKGTQSEVSIPLFTGVGHGTNTANFTNTVFDDNAGTPIQSGGAPFFATFNPQKPLSAFAGLSAKGTWTLVIQNSSTTKGTGTFNGWSLSFQKLLPTTGLGEPGSDNPSGSFRIFTLGQTNALSSQAWTAVGPADIAGGSGRVGGIVIDPSDPSGNTVYVAGASGGIWKTTNFLTTSPGGPTYIPLTDFGPTSGVNIGSITVFGRNHNPNQSIIIAATGEGDTGTPGVGFLISQDGGATWNLFDSLNNVDSSGNLLPIASTARDRTFIGTTSLQGCHRSLAHS